MEPSALRYSNTSHVNVNLTYLRSFIINYIRKSPNLQHFFKFLPGVSPFLYFFQKTHLTPYIIRVSSFLSILEPGKFL